MLINFTQKICLLTQFFAKSEGFTRSGKQSIDNQHLDCFA
jgi:hypothetical protein